MDSKKVLDYFREITTIPRESGHEEPMTEYLKAFAESHNLEYKVDESGNVNIIKQASKGKEDVPVLVLQSHQDMVCEKNSGVQHDFAKDPIHYVIENGWMIAPDTTLGADDGIGIAASLALLESDIPSGRIECVFTISEETGMDGAESMKEGFFTGKTLINLDSEDEGQLFIGCAGGVNTLADFPYETVPVTPGYERLNLKICGGIGGHSGDDINKGRANTIQLLARFLYSELEYGFELMFIHGGNKPNAIARECEATICVPDAQSAMRRFEAFGADVSEEFRITDPGLRFSCHGTGLNEKVMGSGACRRLVSSLFTCPHGVYSMSQDIPGLVETSTNLASVRMNEKGTVRIRTSQRSSTLSERIMMQNKVAANFIAAGAKVEHKFPYPGWKPNVNSSILKVCVESYRRLFNEEPQVLAIHAGLECGLFLDKFPGLDMISFGPTLRGVHAPGERMEIASLDKFVALLADVVTNFR